jgi:hypothetical protein
MASKCCGHHCPVCQSLARPLDGLCKHANGRFERDVPWRFKLGRIAHKCKNKHRFDIDSTTGKPLPDYLMRRPETG